MTALRLLLGRRQGHQAQVQAADKVQCLSVLVAIVWLLLRPLCAPDTSQAEAWQRAFEQAVQQGPSGFAARRWSQD